MNSMRDFHGFSLQTLHEKHEKMMHLKYKSECLKNDKKEH